MALSPRFRGHRLLFARPRSSDDAPPLLHTVELYVDYACPFSAKAFGTVWEGVRAALADGGEHETLGAQVQVLFRHQVQPWHPSSTLLHEAGLAVLRLAPAAFWPFSAALFARQRDFFDVNVVAETRNETYRRLAALAADAVHGISADAVYDLLAVPDKPAADGSLNVGNAVTADVKTVVKMARLVGVHVSPTVVVDGVVQPDYSSSWSVDQWIEWLRKLVV